MRERPIILKAHEVRAILEGRKTQTRRVIDRLSGFGPISEFGVTSTHGWDWTFRDKRALWNDLHHDRLLSACPYGKTGDQLWVRETWLQELHPGDCGLTRADIPRTWDAAVAAAGTIHYRADKGSDFVADGRPWRPSIHMPRRASRFTLEITSVRVERLHEISDHDAVAEGLVRLPASGRYVVNPGEQYFGGASHSPVEVFADLWERINGAKSWAANPYVWVIEFRRIEGAQA